MPRADVFRLLLIKTGATEWDKGDHLSGVADLPLCETGRACFSVSRDSVGDVDLRVVLCGEDQASEQSAALAAEAMGSKVRVCPRLGDVDLGLWQGLRMTEIRERSPRVYKQWVDDPMALTPPEGENLREARDRLMDELARGLERAGKATKKSRPAVAVVLRPMAMALVRARLLDDPSLANWSRIRQGPDFEWHMVPAERLGALRAPVLGGV